MKICGVFILLGLALFIAGCSGNSMQSKLKAETDSTVVYLDTANNTLEIDTANEPGGFLPLADGFAREFSINKDTLSVVTGSPYLYYPFGKHNSINDFKNAYDYFALSPEKSAADTSAIIHVLVYRNSSLKLFFDDERETLEIVSGEISDPQIILINGIATGMDKAAFMQHFFKRYPAKTLQKINTVKLISALDGIIHYCYFENNKLTSIEFISDYVL